ncbi:3,4-dihydroxy-2-butanone-4-phosphate synthase [Candidatus Kinetoplastidibacterium crithidiae]|uniref:3,4-dihydroxy-2-butanone 4-phosphate synthase n=1 Tax=Candidatus Kinetoplastidibacterium crithidiae TCC036E TaxID=1208918 RepID=M1LPG4_9PROT|nr:3,4-dihydroxy-2-butanone-4-phosphate synthase [Candidatus Kinetoplastibacterium crithidii]AFZ82785.1 3,4-dihydroxy 2-butanone 4-phosphate synthase / GTP cyclohydrolase II [Candidatus Kinetoplastibacterium crithidii (ex Angomonas deanei ATCC 30255)]AGF47562.1 3,4-dihydroxy 2-butanone 4-phosphate synthase [Candidatus Kinetoplastibacterium crithidii TCC036E]
MSNSSIANIQKYGVISSVDDIIDELKSGRMIILIDEEDRENEGDLLIAADFVSSESINFMITHARGLVCLTLTEDHCQKLGLSMMTENNSSRYGTNFTQSIEAAKGIGTGISASDRAHTIKVATDNNVTPEDLVQPGHIFPVRSVKGGVLSRAGHTEAGCDLTRMAGLNPAAVICEIINKDGSMARLPDLLEFSKEFNLKIGTISSLIQYRSEKETLIDMYSSFIISTMYGDLKAFCYRDVINSSIHIALVHGNIELYKDTLVSIQTPSSILDVMRVDDNFGLLTINKALERIVQSSSGVLLLINSHISCDDVLRSINEFNKTKPFLDNSKYNLATHGVISQILCNIGISSIRLIKEKNSPNKFDFGLSVSGYEFI